MSHSTPPGIWDRPWYRVSTGHFEAVFLPNAGEDLESADSVDVFVDLKDGSRQSAIMIVLAQVGVIMARGAETGKVLGSRCFWYSCGLVVRDAVIRSMTEVLVGLAENGEFA